MRYLGESNPNIASCIYRGAAWERIDVYAVKNILRLILYVTSGARLRTLTPQKYAGDCHLV
jgi:hypothetical protein